MKLAQFDRPTKLARIAGVDIFVHWSVVALVPMAWVVVDDWTEAVVGAVTLILLILAHEAGHAYFARRRRLEVLGLVVYPFIGYCMHSAGEFEEDEIYVAWGGVVAQAIVLVAAAAIAWLLSSLSISAPSYVYPIFLVLITLNICLIILNLWPAEPLDGGTAWKILGIWRDKYMSRRTGPRTSARQGDERKVVSMAIHRAQKGKPKSQRTD